MFQGVFLKIKKKKMTSVIKTTVTILDTRICSHQCVTMWIKDFKEYLFLKRFLCLKAAVKDLLSWIQHTSGLGPGFNYLKILTAESFPNETILIHRVSSKSIYRKSTKILNLSFHSSLPIFGLQFDSCICLFNFKMCQFYLQNRSFFQL